MNLAVRISFSIFLWFTVSIQTHGWQHPDLEYRSESFGRSFEVSTANRIRLTSKQPVGLSVEIGKFADHEFQFSQFNFGSTANGQIAILLARKIVGDDDGSFRLFVDSNHDRTIETNEEVGGSGNTRLIELPTNTDDPKYNRWVRMRKSDLSNSFSVQTVGGMSGDCAIGEKKVSVRRVDGDGNGMFSDPRDQVWLDLDGDGKWNSITERFPYQLALRLDSNRFLVRGNPEGNKFSLVPIDGEGVLETSLTLIDQDVSIENFGMTLFGDDGASFRIESLQDKPLPVGKYKVGSVSLILNKDSENKPWYFAFSHSGRDGDGDWFEITKDQRTKFDPLGKLNFTLTGDTEFSLDSMMTVRPYLVTETKLYLRESGRQKPDRFGQVTGNDATITALNSLGHIIGQTTSGFQ